MSNNNGPGDDAGTWISSSLAASMLGVSIASVRRMGRLGLIETRTIPGCRRRFSRAHVEEIVSKSVTPRNKQSAS